MLFYKKIAFGQLQEGIDYTNRVSKLEQKDIERCFARTFATDDGKKVLAWLQVMTFQKAGSASTPDEQLRHMEGQRSLVANILRMIDRGRSN